MTASAQASRLQSPSNVSPASTVTPFSAPSRANSGEIDHDNDTAQLIIGHDSLPPLICISFATSRLV